jgi:hypothetical protein
VLSHRGLRIQPPLPGDGDVGAFHRLFQTDGVEHHVDAPPAVRPAKGHKGKAETARRPGAGRLGDVPAKPRATAPENRRRPYPPGGCFGIRPLLGGEAREAPFGPQRGLETSQARRNTHSCSLPSARDASTSATSPTSFPPDARRQTLCVQKAEAQSAEHADARVVCRAPAQADDKIPAALVQGVEYDFTDAVGTCFQGGPLRTLQQGQADGRGYLDHGQAKARDNAVGRGYSLPQQTADANEDLFSLQPLAERVDGPLPAVRERVYRDVRVRAGGEDASLDRAAGLQGAQAFLERIRCNNDLHGACPPVWNRARSSGY